MNSQMLIEYRFSNEGLGAKSAFEWSISAVHPHVLLNSGLLSKPFEADVTLEGFQFDVSCLRVVF